MSLSLGGLSSVAVAPLAVSRRVFHAMAKQAGQPPQVNLRAVLTRATPVVTSAEISELGRAIGPMNRSERVSETIKHKGGCHCGRVRFEVEAPAAIEAVECNCSICAKTGFLHLIVPKSRFTLTQGSQSLVSYTFNTGIAKHLFCRVCGVKSFYVPRSNPDGYSVNVRCLEADRIKRITVAAFDGKNWEDHAGDLAHLSSNG